MFSTSQPAILSIDGELSEWVVILGPEFCNNRFYRLHSPLCGFFIVWGIFFYSCWQQHKYYCQNVRISAVSEVKISQPAAMKYYI